MRSPTPVPGSVVWLRQRRWRVQSARVDRHVVRLDLAHQQQRLTVLAPFDRPEPVGANRRSVRTRRQQARARLAALCGSAYGARDLRAAIAARIDLWPHQLEPALAVVAGQRRILIADEVGLGKTIQAGLILAELQQRRPPLHALIVAPAGLRAQWTQELQTRFGIDAQSAERDLSTSGSRPGNIQTNPWCQAGVWIASIDYIKQRHVLDGLPAVAWDVVVIDEAHAATGHSDRHEACDELGRRARHLVLLSATPHTGDESRFRRIVQMGALPHAFDTIEIFRRTRAEVPLGHGRVVRWRRVVPGVPATQLFDALLQFERVLLQRVKPSRRDAALLLLSVFRKRALSTIAALDRSLLRRLEWLEADDRRAPTDWAVQPQLDFGDGDDEGDEERAVLAVDVGLSATHERTWLRRLRALAAGALARDAKVSLLRRLVSRTREPVVVFTEFRHSLEHVHRELSPVRSVATLHGGQTEPVRGHELLRFLRGDASVLVSTDAGGQGLNLQSRARWIVNLDLPWNPARLEQRIGRVDRLGQTRRVHATLLVTAHVAEDPLLASLTRRTLLARRSVGATTLADCAPPSQLAMAAALFDRAPLLDRPTIDRALPLSLHRRRAARSIARIATTRRRLLQVWRDPSESSRPVRVRGWLPSHGATTAGVVVYSVLAIDRTGSAVERIVVALATRMSPRLLLSQPAGRAALEALVSRRAHARLTRLRRLLPTIVVRCTAGERALALHLHALRYPEEAQLGLFSQREASAFNHARARSAMSAADAANRLRAEDDRLHLELTSPQLEWIGERH